MTFFNRKESNVAEATAVRPVYEIAETPEAYALTVQLPGVTKENLEITGENGELKIVGRRAWKQPEGWTSLYRESGDETFELVLNHANAVNVEQVGAELRDGVLQVKLPKSEALKPRKIAIS